MKKISIQIFILTSMMIYSALLSASEKATFAGGCFWCMEPPFEKLQGVESVTSGFIGGTKKSPSYPDVSSGTTGHVEAVQVVYDPKKIRYEDLLEVFWRQVNPTDSGGQFVDRGFQYTTAIFYYSEDQKIAAEKSKEKLQKSGRFSEKIVTPIKKASEFYPAEKYHQDFYKKSTLKYKYYRFRSGRDQYLDKVWGKDREYQLNTIDNKAKYIKPSQDEIKKMLSSIQYDVTQKEGTEKPFKNEFWNNKKVGIYVDIVTGEPLFSSQDKFDSGTGWPSFTKPLVAENIVEHEDHRLFMKRTEVRSKYGDSHLGHVFNDGPKPTGLRYCINSAALKFIPVSELEKLGYGEFKKVFKNEGMH